MARTTRGSLKRKGTAPATTKKTDARKNDTPEFPDSWVCVAAYYIWEKEGHPHGRETNHWLQAKAQLGDLWKEKSLPTLE